MQLLVKQAVCSGRYFLSVIALCMLGGQGHISLYSQSFDEDTVRAKALLVEGNTLVSQGKLAEAAQLTKESKLLVKQHDLRGKYLLASNNQLKLLIYLGKINEARKIFEGDRAYVFPELDSAYKHVNMHLEIGFRLAIEFEDPEEANQFAQILMRRVLEQESLDSIKWASSLDRMSRVAKMKGNLSKALKYDLQAYQIRKNHPETSLIDLQFSFFNLGQSYRDLGDIGQAIYFFQ
ncbi:MAG: hypothetical protein AAFV07_08020, partial [Bacteroidota bacterium]